MSLCLIRASDVTCERDERILFASLSFSLSESELVQICGPNGAGKSTLLRCLTGLFSGYEGQIDTNFDEGCSCYFGHKITVKRNLTAVENLDIFTSLDSEASYKQYEQALSQVGMAGYEHVMCSDMSEGQRRRVALARVLLSNASVYLLDEPFASLDTQGVSLLESFLKEKADSGCLVVFTTHHQFSLPGLRRITLESAHD